MEYRQRSLDGDHMVKLKIDPFPTLNDLNVLWLDAWGYPIAENLPDVLSRSLAHIGAYDDEQLIGFVNVAWDGGLHAFRTLTRERAWNAKWTLRALKIRDEADCEKMRSMISDIQGTVSAFALARNFDRFADGLNAIWCLVYDGVIELAEPGKKLVDAPWVKKRSQQELMP
jgi:hypothetical protein